MSTQVPILRIVFAAAAAFVIFLVVHTAVEALTRTATALTAA